MVREPGAVYTVRQAKARFSEVIRRAGQGTDITITSHGQPVAQLVRYSPVSDRLTPDSTLRVTLNYDPTEPLGEDEIPEEYR